jgi:chitinase
VAFANASTDDSRRARFARSARNLIDQYSFDGIDSTLNTPSVLSMIKVDRFTVDWEYPEPNESGNYIQLLSCLRSHLPSPRYIVTTALPAGEWLLSRYNLPQLASNIDFLNLMAYDFTGDWGDPRYVV